MQLLNNKVDGAGDATGVLPAAEWNQVPSELQNIITALGMTLSNGDLNQLGKALSGYAASGSFFTDSGAANAYVLAAVGGKQVHPSYEDGDEVEFIAANPSTGASTVNVAGKGVKDIRLPGGTVIQENTITGRALLKYDLGNDWFELIQTPPPSQFKTEFGALSVTETLADIPNLSGFELEADVRYRMEATMGVQSENAAEGLIIRFSSAATGMTRVQCVLSHSSTSGSDVAWVRSMGINEDILIDDMADNDGILTITGFFRTNTNVTLDFQFAKAGAVATDVRVNEATIKITREEV